MMNDLMHYGIKGQSWGVRRYQNLDGTLTDEGKKRYKKDLGSFINEHYVEKPIPPKKPKKKMTEEERKIAEKKFAELSREELRPGEKFMDQQVDKIGKYALKSVYDTLDNNGFFNFVSKPLPKDYEEFEPLKKAGIKIASKRYVKFEKDDDDNSTDAEIEVGKLNTNQIYDDIAGAIRDILRYRI